MNDGQLHSYISRLKRKRRRRFTRFVLLVLAVLTSGYLFFNQFVTNDKENVLLIQTNQTKNLILKDVVENSLKGTEGTYSIAIRNLVTNESYYLNEKKTFETGSLYKLWIMATVYRQIQEGKISEDEALTGDIAALNEKFNIASDSAEFTGGTISLTVKSAIQQMITISHNYAALMLTERIKLSRVADFLKEAGLNESFIGTDSLPPKSNAADIALFYEKLYKGELASQQYTEEMIDLLKNQALNDGLPKYLPAGTKVANKTGDIGWFKHDGGIVFSDPPTGGGDYILVVMSESDSPPSAQEKIAEISKSVYDYFKR